MKTFFIMCLICTFLCPSLDVGIKDLHLRSFWQDSFHELFLRAKNSTILLFREEKRINAVNKVHMLNGIIFKKDNIRYVLTNSHILINEDLSYDTTSKIKFFQEGDEYAQEAVFITYDSLKDLCLLKINFPVVSENLLRYEDLMKEKDFEKNDSIYAYTYLLKPETDKDMPIGLHKFNFSVHKGEILTLARYTSFVGNFYNKASHLYSGDSLAKGSCGSSYISKKGVMGLMMGAHRDDRTRRYLIPSYVYQKFLRDYFEDQNKKGP